MRWLVAGAVAVAGAALIAVVVAARGSDRSACGEVGDRERVASPDGRRAAFVRCTSEGSAWLYVVERGAERRLLPASYGCCYRPSSRVVFRVPSWSPDGRRLAVVIEDVGGVDLWVVNARGRAARRVTSGPAVERSHAGPRTDAASRS
jgi:dipeptidyl aminopeptidase/acylaminoacyl peptidase